MREMGLGRNRDDNSDCSDIYAISKKEWFLRTYCTMLQKLQKCEVKAHSVEIQEFNCHPFLREINIDKI